LDVLSNGSYVKSLLTTDLNAVLTAISHENASETTFSVVRCRVAHFQKEKDPSKPESIVELSFALQGYEIR
jgi:hypothetical protein